MTHTQTSTENHHRRPSERARAAYRSVVAAAASPQALTVGRIARAAFVSGLCMLVGVLTILYLGGAVELWIGASTNSPVTRLTTALSALGVFIYVLAQVRRLYWRVRTELSFSRSGDAMPSQAARVARAEQLLSTATAARAFTAQGADAAAVYASLLEANRTATREERARHEAAHAVVYAATGFAILSCDIHQRGRSGGRTLAITTKPRAQARGRFWDDIVGLMAGSVVDEETELLYGDQDDFEKATTLALKLTVLEHAHPDPGAPVEVIAGARTEAARILATYAAAVDLITAELLARSEISPNRVHEIVRSVETESEAEVGKAMKALAGRSNKGGSVVTKTPSTPVVVSVDRRDSAGEYIELLRKLGGEPIRFSPNDRHPGSARGGAHE
jgi:hypothetical protein